VSADAYAELPADCEWMEPEDWDSRRAFLDRYGRMLSVLPAGARILDCACGTGSAAVALAGLGFEVHGVDGSPAMLARARQRAADAGVHVELRAAAWADLPRAHASRFDAVFCTGNSLAHAGGSTELRQALRGMGSVLRPGGTLIVDGRDGERLREEGLRVSVGERPMGRAGRSCLPARELERCLLDAGLDLLDWEWDEDGDSYAVIAERPTPATTR
jgi:SAM-dependent methyltransferase